MMKRNALRFICLMLVLTVSLIPAFAEVSASVEPSYDYSKEGSYLNETVTAADIIEMLGYTVSDAERAYLEEYYPDEYCPFVFKYERVGGQNVTTERNENQVKIIAAVYSYKAKNGETVTWTPKKAQIGSESIAFSKEGDSYVAVFDGVAPNNELTAKVDYEFDRSISITEEEVNEMLNMAYSNAPTLKAEYEGAETDYASAVESYEQFKLENAEALNKYYDDLTLYEQYLKDKKIYDLKKEQYDENAAEWSDYNAALEKYDQYIADKAIYDAAVNYKEDIYPDLVKEYEADRALYEQYKKDIAIARQQLEALDSGLMDKVTHLDRQVYSSVFSGLVDEVLSYEGAIQDFGVDRQVLDDCGYATISLRLILEKYKAITNESEKYAFYVTNYKRLKENIVLLAQSLEALYTHSIIVSAVEMKDKTEKFVIFVAQMIIFANSINDGAISSHEYSKKGNYTLDKSTVITYKLDGTTYNKTVLEILENDEYVADNENATPLKGGYPQEVLEPVVPEELTELPPKPEYVAKPIAPSVIVEEPTEPTKVEEPVELDGMSEPEKPEILDNTVIKNLIDSIPSLTERGAHNGEFEYTPTVTLEKRIDGVEYVNVVFKDLSGSTLLQLRAEKGTAVNYTEELPEKASDVIADYRFSHWITPDGKEYDITAIDGDVTLYPYFDTVYKVHETDASGNIVVDGTGLGEINEIPMKHLISSAMSAIGELDIRLSNATVAVPYGSLEKLEMHDVESIKLNIDLSGDSYTCKVSTVTSNGSKADADISLNISIPYEDEDFAKKAVVVKLNSDGTETEVSKELETGYICFRVQADCEYAVKLPSHSIILESSSFAELGITLSHTSAMAGEEVNIVEPVLNGVVVKYYYYADGNRYDVSDKKIVMPDCEIQLYAKVSKLKYTVVFISEGDVISSKTYYYGSTPEVPQNPSKPADDDYTYTFKGWSSEVSPVTGDIIYIAEYESTPIVRVQTEEPKLMKLYRIAKICLYVVIGLAVCGVGALVTIKIIKKKNAAEKSDSTGAAESTENTENEEKSRENGGKTQDTVQGNTEQGGSADK